MMAFKPPDWRSMDPLKRPTARQCAAVVVNCLFAGAVNDGQFELGRLVLQEQLCTVHDAW